MSTLTANSNPRSRANELFEQHCRSIHERTDRLFAWLLVAEWIAGILCAVWISPRAWSGTNSSVHPHVVAAGLMGGVITGLPFLLSRLAPGRSITRHSIAVAQMLWSALLIDLTGGRLETHFHVFGSLAFLAFYRDYRVMITATVVVAIDHLARGLWWPESVFGLAAPGNWRWVEHAGWVVFEDAFLIPSCLRGLTEVRTISERQAELEQGKSLIEEQVRVRTSELTQVNLSLATNQSELHAANDQLRKASAEREQLHTQLVSASREAGKAEVATGVLHNVGNVLNSINVSARLMAQRLHGSEAQNLLTAAEMLRANRDQLPSFLSHDERGRHVPEFLAEAAKCIALEHSDIEGELKSLMQGIEHVKQVVSRQQEHARTSQVAELVEPHALVAAALELKKDDLTCKGVRVDVQAEPVGALLLDKHQVVQILINLIANARQAMDCGVDKRLSIRVFLRQNSGTPDICFEVRDQGHGIPPENLTRIFQLGFTTKRTGHGFGLHSSAVAAQSLGGSLTATSAGPGLGATFLLALPALHQPAATRLASEESTCTGS